MQLQPSAKCTSAVSWS